MPTKTKKKATGVFEEELEPILTDAEADLVDFLEELATDTATVDVHRMQRDGTRPHLERVDYSVFREDPYTFLRSNFGAGKYLLTFKDSKRTIRKHKVVDIGAREGAAAPGTPAATTSTFDHAAFMREQQQMMMNLFTTIIAAQRPMDLSFLSGVLKPPDTAGMLTAMVAVMTALQPQKEKSQDWVEQATKIIELARDISPGGGGKEEDSALWGPLKELGAGVVRGMLGGAVQAPAAVITPAPAPMKSGIVAPLPEAPPVMVLTRENIQHFIQTALAELKPKAAAGKDPELWVDVILDNTEELKWSAVCTAIAQGARFEDLLQLDPAIGQNPALRQWFYKLYKGLRDEIVDKVDSTRGARDPGDPGAHEAASAGGQGPAGDSEPSVPAREPGKS